MIVPNLNSKAPWFVTIVLALVGTLERINYVQQETEMARIRAEREIEREQVRSELERLREGRCQESLNTMWEALYRP